MGLLELVADHLANTSSVLGGPHLDLSEGRLETAVNHTDFALQGASFFAVLTKSGVHYTRNISFHKNLRRELD